MESRPFPIDSFFEGFIDGLMDDSLLCTKRKTTSHNHSIHRSRPHHSVGPFLSLTHTHTTVNEGGKILFRPWLLFCVTSQRLFLRRSCFVGWILPRIHLGVSCPETLRLPHLSSFRTMIIPNRGDVRIWMDERVMEEQEQRQISG